MTKSAINTKLPLIIKFGYGGAEGAISLIYTMFYTYGMFFFTDVVQFSPAFAGIILGIGTLWDALSAPLVGLWTDNTKSRWGRRRPFLLAVILPFATVSWLLFSDFNSSNCYSKIFFIIVVCAYFTCFSLLNVPYTALAAEMTKDYDERTSLVTFRAGWSQIVSIIGAAAPLPIAAYFTNIFGTSAAGWSAMAGIFALFTIPMIFLTWRITRGRELYPENTVVRIKDIIKGPLKNRSFLYIIGVYTFGLIAITILGGVGVYYMKYYLKFSENQISISLIIIFGCTILWIPLINYLSHKVGKRKAWFIFIGMWAIFQFVGVNFFITQENREMFFFLGFIISGGVASVYLIGWSMIPDVVEIDEYKTGYRREGLYFSIIYFMQKAACALTLLALGATLDIIGYIPNNTEQSPKVLTGITIILGFGLLFFLIMSIICAYKLPLTRKKHMAICEAINIKKAGGTACEDAFSDIL